jgi:hypothetical protein
LTDPQHEGLSQTLEETLKLLGVVGVVILTDNRVHVL